MIPIVTADQMREIDEETIRHHVPGLILMERAGKGVADEIIRSLKPRKSSRIAVVCGKGNNGGDGFVVTRLLRKKGYRANAYLIGRASSVRGDAEVNLKRCRKAGIKIHEIDKRHLAKLQEALQQASIVVDALFGTGFEGEPRGLARQVIDAINASPAQKIAVDIPSGVNASTGEAVVAVRADITVTMALPKRGHLLFPGNFLTGALVVADIGIPAQVIAGANVNTFVTGKTDVETAMPEKAPQAHKWSCGHVAAICGSTGFTGAAALTSISALRSGCGLVTLAIPRSLNTIMEVKLTEVMTMPVDETPQGSLAPKAKKKLQDLIAMADAVAIGPGLSQNEATVRLVRTLVPQVNRPCVLDADGINAFAGHAKKLRSLGCPLIITPHAGEAARLLNVDKNKILSQPIDFARQVALDLGLVMVLKGAPTIIAGPEGHAFVNPSGNQGLATAGSGDVLTGIIVGLLAQGVSPLEAAYAGVFIHGVLGDMLLEEKRYFGFLAGDLAEKIPEAIAAIISD